VTNIMKENLGRTFGASHFITMKVSTIPAIVTVITLLLFCYTCYVMFMEESNSDLKTLIIVLGGGVSPDLGVPKHTQLRIDRAIEHYKRLKGHATIITLSGGTPHKPNPLDKNGFPVWEATAAARRLIEMGVPSSSVVEEAFSLDTLGNVSTCTAHSVERRNLVSA
jgi:DUF218 domain